MAWHAKTTGGYDIDSSEALENAQNIYTLLSARGWTINAVCGLLGNIQNESVMNPWRWESDDVQESGKTEWGRTHGYGLVQFTDASKYINSSLAQSIAGYGPNFSNQTGNVLDGQAQTIFIHETHSEQYSTSDHSDMTYDEYIASTESPETLTEIWMWNYERPNEADGLARLPQQKLDASKWYDNLTGYTPTPTPTPTTSHKMKWIFYLKRR